MREDRQAEEVCRNELGPRRRGYSIAEEETPSLQNLDRYIEGMYDDPETATQATYMILQLARSPENLEALLENEALLGLLARLLHLQ